MKAKLSCTIHGLTRSLELIDILKKLDLGISYQDVKNLLSSWTVYDLRSNPLPKEITNYYPGNAVMDNGDFKDD